MVLKRLVVVIVALALVLVAIGAGYIALQGHSPPVVTPPPGPAPTVTFTSPAYQAVGTPLNAKILAMFSQPMNSASITSSTFTVKHGSTVVPGTVTYTGTTATFSPTSVLTALTAHTATITTGAKDATGVAMAFNFEWGFTTGQTPDIIAPLVSFTSPAPGATAVAVNVKVLATFSKAIDPETITLTTFSVRQGSTAVAGIVTYAGSTAVFYPSNNFAFDTAYTATITNGVKDVAGNALVGSFVWTFRTGQLPESVPPRVSSTSTVFAVPVDSSVSAMFTEVMDPTSIGPSTFLLYQGTTAVPGVVSYTGLTATYNPTNNFAFDTTYTATITTGSKDLAGNALQANFVWTFRTAILPDTLAPRVSSTSAVNNVAIDSSISAMFSEAMDPSTITVANFQLSQGSNSVAGIVTYAGITATFDPTANFEFSTLYTATIATGARDLAGNGVLVNYVWSFTTIARPDTDPPRVTSTSPVVNVPIDSSISAMFSEAMDPATTTVSSFLIYQGTTSLAGLVNYAGVTVTFNPDVNFAYETTYTATITTGARDLAGNPLGNNFEWTFRTSMTPDTTRPIVTAVGPFTDVALDSNIQATFSEAMDPTTVTTATFTLMQGSTLLSGLVDFANLTATFNPDANFSQNTTYTATVSTGARDLAGNAVSVDFVWTFTTRGPIANPCAQLGVTLGRVSTFAILAGSTIVNTGSTLITGDIGVSPSDAIVGFPPGNYSGTAYWSNTVDAAQAMENLTVAYNDAAGRTLCPVSVSGNIGGQTLAPGLYKSTSGLEISSGDLTLDAQGDANAIWIFQIASTLDTSTDLKVILAGGAQSKNIFWQVGTSATLGTTSTFCGTIMADQAITLGTGATLNGRALARIAAVNLDANIVVVPA
jgi:tetrahydromethanopterin S-methyltransferase subunit B